MKKQAKCSTQKRSQKQNEWPALRLRIKELAHSSPGVVSQLWLDHGIKRREKRGESSSWVRNTDTRKAWTKSYSQAPNFIFNMDE